MHNRMIWIQGDITHLRVDAIVNAARSSLKPGGGVCGAIHRAAGPHLKKLCSQRRQLHGSCDTGKAVITDAGSLSVRKVIHAVGPVWYWGWRSHVKQTQFERLSKQSCSGCRARFGDNCVSGDQYWSLPFSSTARGPYCYYYR